MKRWKRKLLGLGLAAIGLVGCKQQLFEREKEIGYYRNQALKHGAPPLLETDINSTVQPLTTNLPPKPPTVDDPDRPVRHLTLHEAISIALEQGTTGFLTLGGGLGTANESVQSGRGGTFSDSVRVLALDPAIAGADIEGSLAKFDARWITSQTWGKRDEAAPNAIQSFQNGDTYNLNTGIFKPLPTGGVAGITFNVDYLKSDNPGFFLPFNPTWRPRLQLQFEQPLLQNYGVEINQLLVNHPGSSQIPRFRPPGGGRVEGILVARVRFDQAKAEFERNMSHMLLNVEAAYWNLYAAYGTLFARDRALLEAYDLYKNVNARTRGGLDAPQDVERALAQLEQFRAVRYSALGQVIESERQLRLLLGLSDDNTRLVPIDQPTLAEYSADWNAAVNEALNNRPELIQARQDLKVRQFEILIQKNQLKPDLRFFANYDMNGVGDQLDGSLLNTDGSFSNAMGIMALNKNNSWQFGFLMDVPIGYRDAHSSLRVARLNLLRSYASLRDNERKVLQQLRNQYSRLNEFQRTMQAQNAQYRAAQRQYEILQNRRDLQSLAGALEQLLTAQRTVAEARAAEFRAIADYNNTLAGFQFAKGTIMSYDNVVIGEGPLPEAAQIRAVDHFRERTNEIVTRERPAVETAPAGVNSIMRDPLSDVMPIRSDAAPTVLQMMQPRATSQPGTMNPPPAANVPIQPPFKLASPAGAPGANPGLPQRPAAFSATNR